MHAQRNHTLVNTKSVRELLFEFNRSYDIGWGKLMMVMSSRF